MTEPSAPFRCATCGCRSYARVAERKSDDSFGPGPQVRCVECKSVVSWPPADPDAAPAPMSHDTAMAILGRHHMIGGYYGPGYRSWHAVQGFMDQHPRGRGLSPGSSEAVLYEACRIYQAERSRTRRYVPQR